MYNLSRHLCTILPRSLGPCTWFLPLQIQRTKNSAPERQFSARIFSIKRWSNRVIKTALSRAQYVLKHTRTSDQSLHFFLERWAPKLLTIGGSRTDRNSCCNANNCQNLAVPSAWIPSRHLFTIFPRSLGPCTRFQHLQIQK
jgi:hypothetical protein